VTGFDTPPHATDLRTPIAENFGPTPTNFPHHRQLPRAHAGSRRDNTDENRNTSGVWSGFKDQRQKVDGSKRQQVSLLRNSRRENYPQYPSAETQLHYSLRNSASERSDQPERVGRVPTGQTVRGLREVPTSREAPEVPKIHPFGFDFFRGERSGVIVYDGGQESGLGNATTSSVSYFNRET